MRETGIAILSDRKLFREGAVQFLQAQGYPCVSGYSRGAELLRALQDTAPRLVLVDMDHSAEEPLPLVRELRGRAPHATVVLAGMAWAASGVAQGVPGPSQADLQQLRAVASLTHVSGQTPLAPQPPPEPQLQAPPWPALTPRQREVLCFLATGSDNLKIAANLGISERAVKAHVSALLTHFHAENRTELAVMACRAGLRPPLRSVPGQSEPPQAQAG